MGGVGVLLSPPPTSHHLARLYFVRPWAQLEPAASELGLLLGEGCLPVAKVPGFRLLKVGTVMLYSLLLVPSLFLLVMPIPSHGWSRPLWYQVGLDLQPWGCQPNNLDSCRSSLGCPGYWMGLGENRIYPVAGVTITTTMLLVISRVVLHRWRAKVSKSQVSTTMLCPLQFLLLLMSPGPRPPIQPSSYQPGLGPVGFLYDPVLIPMSCSYISTEPMSTTNPSLSSLRASTLVHLSPLNIPILHPATIGPRNTYPLEIQ